MIDKTMRVEMDKNAQLVEAIKSSVKRIAMREGSIAWRLFGLINISAAA